ncbi:helix-turn-helix domain-containing protein [Paenibacillus sp. LMG 31456]|uniref:Helix-turn-helix domain-containing protein n=1 Tax=Paenibacillus foliorum TaxID=2654974 RepID=A0A972GMC4_9BACL|nr:helix-turn-helix domain-containing protein [Paenibacillus foliorum]NOU92660.1 helix-turn-helix domain-containing protein [Paenibacillus foliorum]
MLRLKWAALNRHTLVFKIFFSFLAIILLFSVFNLLSVHLFNKFVQHEIIQYNRLMLKNTAERYQTHFERIRTLMFDIYTNEKVVYFNRQMLKKDENQIEFYKASDVLKDLRSQAYNPMFYLNNLLIYFDSRSLIIEKEGTVEAEMLFTHFYASDSYPLAFWKEQFHRSDNYVLHSENRFKVSTLNNSKDVQLIPYSFRMTGANYQVIALLDANLLKEAFYGTSDNRQFMILHEDGTLLYRSGDLSASDIVAFDKDIGYSLSGDYYFFFEKDADAALTYVTAVPYSNIASKVRNANWTLLLIFAVSIVIGILASLYLSRKINRPIKQMVTSILRRDPAKLESAIHEFDLIHQNIRDLMQEKEVIHQDLLDKRSLLTSFAYINKLKAITSSINEWKDIAELDDPFFIVLFQLHFKTKQVADRGMETDRMAYYIQEYINLVMSECMPSSQTFQIENNQILSLIRDNDAQEELDSALMKLKTILDRDKALFLVTIAISPVYEHSASFNTAYREVLKMAQRARPADENQIIWELRNVPAQVVLTVQQEQELYANLQAGNHLFCISFMERMLDQFDKKEAGIQQLRQLAVGIIARVVKILEPYGADADGSMQQLHSELMQECCTLSQFKQFYNQLFHTSAAIIQSRKDGQDSVISFVMDYVENRFADDLSLDLLADKLNMSVAYLSVYIKEKTGVNFSEHINAVRIRKAKELLALNELSVQDISSLIGYRNVTSFIRMFKKMTGMPPGEFRRNQLFEQEKA